MSNNDNNEKYSDKEEGKMPDFVYTSRIPFIIREDKTEEFLEKCRNSGLTKERRQELIDHAKSIRRESHNFFIEVTNEMLTDNLSSNARTKNRVPMAMALFPIYNKSCSPKREQLLLYGPNTYTTNW